MPGRNRELDSLTQPKGRHGGSAAARRRSWTAQLFKPVSIVPLIYARLVFGALMIVEVARYFGHGWIGTLFIEPEFHFGYYGFEWVRPWPGVGMYVHFAALGLLALFIMAGFLYRLAAGLFFLGFTYVFLLEEVLYLNHFYLLCLVSFLLFLLPAHRAASLDAKLRPAIRTNVAPAWTLFLLRFQVAVPYFFGGIAKLNADWLRGEPMRMWLARRTDFWLVGPWFTREEAAWFFSYGGLLLDLLIVPMLLWKRTRLPAMAAMALFHIMNSMLFRIGIFPWFMLAATLLFFPAAKWARLGQRWLGIRAPGDAEPALATEQSVQSPAAAETAVRPTRPALRYAAAGFVLLWVAVQVLVPLRHFLYPGVVHWTEEGHRFSWHMKLRAKQGRLFMHACDPNSRICWDIEPLQYIRPWQLRRAAEIPDMILQLAHHVADDLREKGYGDVEIFVDARVTLNGREPQLLINPYTDLARVERSLRPAGWILPMKDTPLGWRPPPRGNSPAAG